MSYPVIISSEVRLELIKVQDLLESERAGYGILFADSFEQTINLIAQFPFSNRIRIKKSRAIQLPRFSYLLVYKVYNDVILVQRMVHVKRSLRKRYGT
ncbi:MAG TPA: hypothetical protein VK826_12790 [Bacteroidia bacterium]|nr:hypothetical protein [Bacteroidia bacterium]